MNKISVIDWISIDDEKPFESGWYMVVLKPKNYMEFIDNPRQMNDWMSSFGMNKIWYHNGEFWEDGYKITGRIAHWGQMPSVPLYE